MDYQELYKILPKPSNKWTINEIQIWLKFINLQSLCSKFKQSAVDGSCLHLLTEEDLINQLEINSKIVRKKILKWIEQAIPQYDKLLNENNMLKFKTTKLFKIQEGESPETKKQLQKKRTLQVDHNEQQINNMNILESQFSQMKLKKEQKQQPPRNATHRQLKNNIHQQNQLIIRQCEVFQAPCFYFNKKGGNIGRHSNNEVQVVDECVSRFHAEILFENDEYFLVDCGSSSGTFIKIDEKMQIFEGMIVQMGSNQFQFSTFNTKIVITVIQGPNLSATFTCNKKKNQINIGRKTTNQISFPDDQHLSNIHSKVYEIDGIWFIQDMGTTNGTWIRLSPEGVKSQQFPLLHQTQFKIGLNNTYQCQRSQSLRKTFKNKLDKCMICKKAQRDTVFIPCKHSLCCSQCANEAQLKNCLQCGTQNIKVMKIFKV